MATGKVTRTARLDDLEVLDWHAVIDAAPDAMIVVNAAGQIQAVNRQFENLFGYSRDDILGHPVELLLPERYREGHLRFRKGYNSNPRPRAMGENRDLWALRKDGSEFPVAISLSAIQRRPLLVAAAIRPDQTRRTREALLTEARMLVQSVKPVKKVSERAQRIAYMAAIGFVLDIILTVGLGFLYQRVDHNSSKGTANCRFALAMGDLFGPAAQEALKSADPKQRADAQRFIDQLATLKEETNC